MAVPEPFSILLLTLALGLAGLLNRFPGVSFGRIFQQV
jgi:hypothetical protein